MFRSASIVFLLGTITTASTVPKYFIHNHNAATNERTLNVEINGTSEDDSLNEPDNGPSEFEGSPLWEEVDAEYYALEEESTLAEYYGDEGPESMVYDEDGYGDEGLDYWNIIDDTSNEEDLERRQLTTANIGTFAPLECNANLDSASCSNSLSSISSGSGPLTVDCGECYTYDLGEEVTLADGLWIKGKLIFTPNTKATINVDHVIVEGELEITDTREVSASNAGVKFVLTGDSDRLFVPTASNTGACAGGGCQIGTKAFVVAGGKLNINGMKSGCPTWMKLKETTAASGSTLDLSAFPEYVESPSSCPAVFIDEDFENGIGKWKGGKGAFVFNTDGSLVIKNRKKSWQGPFLDFTSISSCLIPDQDYLLTTRFKLEKGDLSVDTPTSCASGSSCLKLFLEVGKMDDGVIRRDLATYSSKDMVQSYGQWATWSRTVKWSSAELDQTNVFWTFQMRGVEADVDVHVDYFKITLPSRASYPDTANGPCRNLVLNGGADANGFNPYPMYRTHAVLAVLEEGGNKFFRMMGRTSHWNSMKFNINGQCFEKGQVFHFSQKVRIHSTDATGYYVQLIGYRNSDGSVFRRTMVTCPSQSLTDGWVICSGEYTIDEDMADSSRLYWEIIVNNHQGGNLANIDYDDVQVEFKSSPVGGLVLDGSVSQCWGEGSEVHITSSTMSYGNSQNGVISSVTTRSDGTALVELEDAINAVISEAENADFAVEVALLSRNVRIESANKDDSGSGGYMQILHTPGVAQKIDGVEFGFMGQEGVADRFNLQFVYSGDVNGAVVSRNSMRDSNHRCVSIAGTSNLTISENVAYRTTGHCFYVGFESFDNKVLDNLGSVTKYARNRISSESDNYGSTFFSYYVPNRFEGNVAAGGERYGFYLHNWRWTRSESGSDAQVDPRKLHLGSFINNVAHSFDRDGFRGVSFHQSGIVPIENLKSYRNRGVGVYFYDGMRAKILGGHFADNQVGVHLHWSDDVEISNAIVQGNTAITKAMTASESLWKLCPGARLIGIKLQTLLHRSTWTLQGSKIENVAFSDFDDSPDCPASVPIAFDGGKRDGHWDYLTSLQGITVSDNRGYVMDGCGAKTMGVMDIVMSDIDGSLSPMTPPKSGMLVSDTDAMRALLGDKCTNLAEPADINCMAYCADVCTRGVSFSVEADGTEGWMMRVADVNDGTSVEIAGLLWSGSEYHMTQEGVMRKFSVSLRAGEYTVEFLDTEGLVSWPTFVEEKWEGVPECTGYASAGNVTIIEPSSIRRGLASPGCDNLIENGSMNDGTTYRWRHHGGGVEYLEEEGINGTGALGTTNRRNVWQGIGQNLDSLCVEGNVGGMFELKAWYRVVHEDGSVATCDPNKDHSTGGCPAASMRYSSYKDPEEKTSIQLNYKGNFAVAVRPHEANEFNLIHGLIKFDQNVLSKHRFYLYFERFSSQYEGIFDEVSLTPFPKQCDEIVMNNDFSEGTTVYWDTWDSPNLEMVEGMEGPGSHGVKVTNRAGSSSGVRQEMNFGCLSAGDRIAVSANYRLVSDDGSAVSCDPFSWNTNRCTDVHLHTRKIGFPNSYYRLSDTLNHLDVPNGWYTTAGIFTIPEKSADADHASLYMSGLDASVNIIMDNVSIKKIPEQCDSLILNPSFDDGTSFWIGDRKNEVKVKLSPGAGGSGHALMAYDRAFHWRGVYQRLDPRCFVAGAEYVVTAKFKLLNGMSSAGMTCDPTIKWRNDEQCPSVMLQAYECDGSNVYEHLWNVDTTTPWNPAVFNDFSSVLEVDDNLASCDRVYVHVKEINPAWDIVMDDFQIMSTSVPVDGPTSSPTATLVPQTEFPTMSPVVITPVPTTSTALSCPGVSEEVFLNAGTTRILRAASGEMCLLSVVVLDNVSNEVVKVLPLARSYDEYDWELSSGSFPLSLLSGADWSCFDIGCQIDLPPLSQGQAYRLMSFEHSLSQRDEVARFLESASFGPTKSDLEVWDYSVDLIHSFEEWVSGQVDASVSGVTSHREFWRARANSRLTHPRNVGTPDHPCSANSRWRKFTFTRKDAAWWLDTSLRVTGSGPHILRFNGNVRTVVDSFKSQNANYADYVFNENFDYELCNSWPVERIDGSVNFLLEDATCVPFYNPAVNFTNHEDLLEFKIEIPYHSVMQPIDQDIIEDEVFILLEDIDDDICRTIPPVREGNEHVFVHLPDGTWLQHDPYFVLEENTPSNPLKDGGAGKAVESLGDTLCSNAPRTFMNEDQCILSDVPLCDADAIGEITFELNEENLLQLHSLTGRYVYAILGLPVVDEFNSEIDHPCEPDSRSRWERKPLSECNPTSLHETTKQSLLTLLNNYESDPNPSIRDIHFPVSGLECDSSDTDPVIEIVYDGDCWVHVHPEHKSVYDMTYWTESDTHPGNAFAAMQTPPNPHPIKKWIDIDESAFLVYPSRHPRDASFNHGKARWDNNHIKFPKLGRFGDSMRLQDLPLDLRSDEVNNYFGATNSVKEGVLVCGSYGEVSNEPSKGTIFDVATGSDTSFNLGENRGHVWTMAVLEAPDQLRQRVAWAFSQIFVVVPSAVGEQQSNTELFLNYYDIFSRNAFGNFLDILREVSYNGLMAENLSYLRSRSAAYMWKYFQQISFADENFAREIMQLFSTGIVQLNIDGTPKLDDSGNEMLVYTNDEIMSFARAWTGFDLHSQRGNIEDVNWSGNRMDPMRIEAPWRDMFPKNDLAGGYIGDRFALCVDLPPRTFLKKGATYRLLGSSPLPELMKDPSQFESESSTERFVLGEQSELRDILCNEDTSGSCRFANSVVLTSNLECAGDECDVDTLRVVQVGSNIYYEYVAPPCVQQAFYDGAMKVSRRNSWDDATCANPLLPVASAACCSLGTTNAVVDAIYDGERVTFATSDERCRDKSLESCDFTRISGVENYQVGLSWAVDQCKVRVRVNPEGYGAIVYEPEDYFSRDVHVNDENRNIFKLYWSKNNQDTPFPHSTINGCANGACSTLSSGDCLCDTFVRELRVFGSIPSSANDALEKLKIGAYDPSASEVTYLIVTNESNDVTAYLSRGAFNTDTIFEVTDDTGRKVFLKNVRETVHVEGAPEYSFRNAPHFMSLLETETSVRDAQYETEATLDHYFRHPNTAPFIATRLIQRLVLSNPTPRYVKTVATAFKKGSFQRANIKFGDDSYGNLEATVAAIILDREARSVVLEKDPSFGMLREPMLKVMNVMRSLEFEPKPGHPITRLVDMDRRIGQMPHEFPTVFSFFLPEHVPNGRIADSSLVSPEGMLLDMPKTINVINGLFSMVKYGLSSCYDGFGERVWICREGDFTESTGFLSLKDSSGSNEAVSCAVDDLATLLTAGRLSKESRNIVENAYKDAEALESGSGSLIARQLIMTSPEFHSTNLAEKSGEIRPPFSPPQGSNEPYKAVVYLMFSGGCDSYNLLVPFSCSGKDMYQEYRDVREQVALLPNQLNEISTSDQVCETFGVNKDLDFASELYNAGDLLFFANTGVMDVPDITKDNYWQVSRTQLFAHNHMQREAQRVDPYDTQSGTGIIGRMSDSLTRQGYNVGSFSIERGSVSLIGKPGVSPAPSIVDRGGVSPFNENPSTDNMMDHITALNEGSTVNSGVFSETWSDHVLTALAKNDLLYQTLEGTSTNTDFPDTYFGQQVEIIAKMIQTREERGSNRDMFFVSTGGFDTHSDVGMNLQRRFVEVNEGIKAFTDELNAMGLWDAVTTIQTSDFARTLVPNSGDGTDHAWGGNYMMFGGSVKGGKIVGDYPDDLTDEGPLGIGRGRLIPTTPWDACFKALAEWVGVSQSDMGEVCPNCYRFNNDDLFSATDLFE